MIHVVDSKFVDKGFVVVILEELVMVVDGDNKCWRLGVYVGGDMHYACGRRKVADMSGNLEHIFLGRWKRKKIG